MTTTKTLAIKVFYGDQLVDTQTLTQDVIKIGKLKSSHICLDDEAVARMHAVIEVSGEEVRVIDLGSAAGTVLNGQRIDKNAVLHDGDALNFGPYRLEVGFAKQQVAAAPAPAQVAAPVAVAAAAVAAAPLAAAPMATRAPIQIDLSEVEVQSGSRVAEVVAMYGSTVLDVQHVGQLKNRKSQAPLFLAIGGVMLAAGTAVFFSDVNQDWPGYGKRVQESIEQGTPRPTPPGNGLAAIGMLLAIAGLVPFSMGLIRTGDYVNKNFTIGEGHGASFHVPPAGLPEPNGFPLVRGSDHEFALNFTQNMSGEVTFDGQTITLQQLVATGRAGSQGSSFSFPLPPGATARVKYQDVTFYVNSVAPGAVIKGGSETDKPFWIYNGASFVVIGSLLVLTHLIPNEAGNLSLDEMMEENRFVGYLNQPDKPPEEEEPPPEDMENSDDEAGGTGQRHKGEEGKMGKPTSKTKSGLYAMKGPKDAIPQMARNFDPDMAARQAGILGVMSAESGHFLASPYGGAFAVGNDDADVWGGLTGTEIGEAYGVGGLGLVGTGRGGGGTGEGTIGLGNTGLIGKGGGGGTGSGYGRGAGAGFGGRGTRVPTVRQAKAEVQGALDKDIIRRIVRAHINEVRYCYNQALARDPNAKGRVAVQFTIGGTGKVPTAVVQESTMKDPAVGSCIAQAVKRWTFPKPEGGGSVIVSYPFVLEPG
ncbi:AgmX/PglI C-terminal domain-containing protein [Nannocystis pusilla]|uniref:AgmX/PglI C-terminal domain-containing protein n=4 Tax=Nannocystis pusilla TaxID=889268 RepID=A0A9X3EWC7_9BACT|nr:AgmX/PglI C-terminal domain-containing protein [Nannocystis pusilla]MCY1006798.1 AgmX/PglI C-terminal domain-containing protein [Nannocystis pusilla]